MMDQIQERLLAEVADLHGVPEGAYNIRANGKMAGRSTTANIDITTKTDKPGIDIKIKPGTKHESVHIPVVVSASGLKEMVYNDFHNFTPKLFSKADTDSSMTCSLPISSRPPV